RRPRGAVGVLHRRRRPAVRLYRPCCARPARADPLRTRGAAGRRARRRPVLRRHRGGTAAGGDRRGHRCGRHPGGGAMTEEHTRRRRRPHAIWGVLLWLTVVWVFLWGELTLASVVNGLVIGLVITTVLPLPRTPFNGRFRPWGTILLIAHFLWDVELASIEVAKIALRREPPKGAVIRVRLRSHNDVYLTMV